MSPQYVNIVDAVKLFFSNYVNFRGRSTRSEYWWVMVASIFISIIIAIINGIIAVATDEPSVLFTTIVCLALLLPIISLCIRRLHDVGKSGWFILLALLPIVDLYLIYLYCQPSDGPNQWGEPASNY